MNISALLCHYEKNSGVQGNNLSELVALAIVSVIQNYYLKWSPSFVLIFCCRYGRVCLFYTEMMERLHHLWGTPPVQIVNVHKNADAKISGLRNCNIILVDSYESFLEIDIISYTAEYNFNEYYYIFLQTRDCKMFSQINLILDYCWRNYIINCNVQIQTAKGEVLVYSYFPFTLQHCRKVVPVVINRFVNGAFARKRLFPRKLQNFYGCTLRAALWHVPPYVYLNSSENGEIQIKGGFEGVLLQMLVKKLNFTIEVIIPPNDEQRGRIGRNNTVNGALSMLRDRVVDLSLGSFRQTAERVQVATSTLSYYQTVQVFCALKSAFSFSSKEIFLFPFQKKLWLLFILVSFICLMLVRLANTYRGKCPQVFPDQKSTHTYLNMLLMAIGMTATTMPRRDHARLHCVNFMFASLIIRTVYLALLFHLIRLHLTHRLPQTEYELLAKNYTIVMNRATHDSAVSVPFIRQLKMFIINSTMDTIAFYYMEHMVHEKLVVGAAPLDFLLHYVRVKKRGGVFKILPIQLFSQPLTMYLTKHSFLIDEFNHNIMWMREVGLIEAWTKWELKREYFNSESENTNIWFGLTELYMIFVVGFYSLSGALIVFALELLSKHIKCLKYVFEKI